VSSNETPSESEFLSRSRNYLGSIRKDLKDLQGARALMGELTQNADDAGGATLIRFEVTSEAFVVSNDGEFTKCADLGSAECDWRATKDHRCDFHSFREVASGDKESREATTGAFGIGFTSVYQVTDRPELVSNGEHWVLDEGAAEGQRIKRDRLTSTDGTRFVLPWAREDSEMRRSLAQPAMNAERISALADDLLDVAPELLLFLLRVRRLEMSAAEVTTAFASTVQDDVVTIERSDGSRRQWLLLAADFAHEAVAIQQAHPELVGASRPTEVTVAIELETEPSHGRFFVTLPTEQSTELPLSINGSFFPKPDRKRIRLDDGPESLWNEAIIDCAAKLLADSLEHLVDKIGDDWIVHLLRKAHDLSKRAEAGSVDGTHAVWWTCLEGALADRRIVPTLAGGHRTTRDVWLTNDPRIEGPAAPVLAKLGVHLIHTNVRSEWYELNGEARIGLRQLRLDPVVEALEREERNIEGAWITTALADDERPAFWSVVDHLTETRSSETIRARASHLPLIQLENGIVAPPAEALRVQAGERQLLIDGAFVAPVIEPNFARSYPRLAELAPPLTPDRMAELASELFVDGDASESFDRARVLDWFANRKDESVLLGREPFDVLPIFPTGTGFATARDLLIPSDGFDAPLKRGDLYVRQHRPGVVQDFLVELGVPRLDLEHFCTDLVPSAIESGLSGPDRDSLVRYLAQHLSQLKDNAEVRRALHPVALVLCRDGVARRADEVYLGDVSPLVVGSQPVAAPTSQLIADLFEWLGASAIPRPSDVINQCRRLTSDHSLRSDAVSAILEHLNEVDGDRRDRHYAALQPLRWLPAQGVATAVKPTELFSTFQRYLFESQAQFLAVPPATQQRASDVLRWLGVRSEPSTEHVVKHLLHCSAAGTSVNAEVWTFLNRHAEDTAIERLVGKKVLEVEGRGFTSPASCFWDSNPFGRHRVLLAEGFRRFRAVLDVIGVRSVPDADDAVELLGDIATAHGGSQQSLLAEDIPIVQSCWALLDQLVRAGDVEESHWAELRGVECVLDASNCLRQPSDVLFRDGSQVARQLSAAAAARLIARPDNMKAALDAVGVRHLRDAIEIQIAIREDRTEPSRFKDHVAERRPQFARVLDGFVTAPFELLDAFERDIDVLALDRLAVVERLDFAGAPTDPIPLDRAALWIAERSELLVVEGGSSWPEVAREFALALGIDKEDVARVASQLMIVLQARTAEGASQELDQLGVADVGEAIDPGLESIESSLAGGVSDGGEQDDVLDPSDDEVPSNATAEQKSQSEPQDPEHGAGNNHGSRAEPAAMPRRAIAGTGLNAAAGLTGSRSRSPSSRDALRRPKDRQRMVSYVAPSSNDDQVDEHLVASERRSVTDEAAIAAVLDFEQRMGRSAQEMDHSNPGYDIESVEPGGSLRYIEVKGTAGTWDSMGVGITSRQFDEALRRGDQYWLYVVAVAADGSSEPYRIQNPAGKIDRYYFDSGWKAAADDSVQRFQELPEIATASDPLTLATPIPLYDYSDGTETGAWVECPTECVEEDLTGLFAVRIAGETLGLAYRGGVAFAVSAHEAADRDPVVVRLLDQTDPRRVES